MKEPAVIARLWTGSTSVGDAPKYLAHLERNVIPELSSISGHRGIYVLQRAEADTATCIVMTLWESMESIRRFSGPDVEAAVVAPEARAVLRSYERRVTHYDVVLRSDAV